MHGRLFLRLAFFEMTIKIRKFCKIDADYKIRCFEDRSTNKEVLGRLGQNSKGKLDMETYDKLKEERR